LSPSVSSGIRTILEWYLYHIEEVNYRTVIYSAVVITQFELG